MRLADVLAGVQIGDGAGGAQDAVIAARRQPQLFRRQRQQRPAIAVERRDLFKQPPGGIGIDPRLRVAGEALRLQGARLALLARQYEAARADLTAAAMSLGTWFDPASRRTQSAATTLQQLQVNMKAAETPQLDDTFAALATAAAGR